MPTLLVVDDDAELRYSLEKSLRSDTLDVLTAETATQGLDVIRQTGPDAVVLDVRLPDMSGLQAFDCIREIDPRLPVIVVTAFAATDTAIEAMKRGAFEYLLKPVDLHQLRSVVAQAVELRRLRHVPAVFHDADHDVSDADHIVGHSPVMHQVYKAIGRAAPLDVTVLVLGESGTGKELVARALYHHSRRGEGPFLAINCAAIPDTLLESELFGHERGAFTGADRRRIGKFEQANQGTILLDEIGDMPLPLQAKLLRLLQERRFDRLGGNQTVQSDVRVIATTHQDLEAAVAAGRFRQDLFYRLTEFTIRMPPLRERLEDVPLLAEYLRRRFNRELGKQVRAETDETLQLLARHAWPGNIRELRNAIRFAMIHATSDTLTPESLPEYLRQPTPADVLNVLEGIATADVLGHVEHLIHTGQPDIYEKVTAFVDRAVLESVLKHTHGNQGQAAELLGLSRNTLKAKLRSLGLCVEKHLQEL
jgi:two-component system nitrogen regulation response regulator GlnG